MAGGRCARRSRACAANTRLCIAAIGTRSATSPICCPNATGHRSSFGSAAHGSLTDHHLARERLELLASELERTWPDAAASRREGMDDTLTLMRLGIDGQLAKTLCSTNPCESMVRHEAPCERRERTNNSHPCRLEYRPWADAAARRSGGQPRRGIARWRWEQPRQRSGRAALPDARVRASKTERQSVSKAVVEAS